MRRPVGYLAILFSIALLILATAGASPAWRIRGEQRHGEDSRGATENEPLRANDPHVQCSFHIHGFNFDGGAAGTWRIEGWAPTGGGTFNGNWGPANSAGDWRTSVMTIPPGHYKLFVWQTTPNDPPGGAKQKVFWVECGSSTGNTSGTSNGTSNGNANGNSNGNANGNSSGVTTGVTTGVSTGVSNGNANGNSNGNERQQHRRNHRRIDRRQHWTTTGTPPERTTGTPTGTTTAQTTGSRPASPRASRRCHNGREHGITTSVTTSVRRA